MTDQLSTTNRDGSVLRRRGRGNGVIDRMALRRRAARGTARVTRAALAAVLVGVGSGTAAACGPAPLTGADPANRAEGSHTIVWVSSPTLRNASDDVRQALVDAFEQAYPSIKVRLEPGSDSTDRLRTKLLGELADGSDTPDVYSGDVIWPAEFGAAGLALPLNRQPSLTADFWSRFSPAGTAAGDSALLQAMTYQGNVYAVPYFVDQGFLFYRKDLLKEAGLAPPATWEQLVHDAQVLKSEGKAYRYVWQGDDYEGLTCDWMEFLADASGGLPAGADQAALAAELASPAALKALDFMRSLITDGISPQNTNTLEEPDGDRLFDEGSAAFLRSWDSSYASAMGANSAIDDPAKVGVLPLPRFAGQHGPGYSTIGGWNLFVNPHSRNLGQDLTFLQWMTGPQAQRILAGQFSEIPGNFAVRDSVAVGGGNPVLAAARQTRQVGRPSSTPDYGSLSKTMYSAVHSALPGPGTAGADPCTALVNAAHAIDPDVHGTLTCSGASASASGGGSP